MTQIPWNAWKILSPSQSHFATKDNVRFYQDVQIPAGATGLSGAIDLGDLVLLKVIVPSQWTAANITFQDSKDGVNWLDIYTATGSVYTLTAAASRAIFFPINEAAAAFQRWLRIRSGTPSAAVNQTNAPWLRLIGWKM